MKIYGNSSIVNLVAKKINLMVFYVLVRALVTTGSLSRQSTGKDGQGGGGKIFDTRLINILNLNVLL